MGVGPKPIPIDKLDTPSLVEALQFMLRPEVQEAAKKTGKGIEQVLDPPCLLICCEHNASTSFCNDSRPVVKELCCYEGTA